MLDAIVQHWHIVERAASVAALLEAIAIGYLVRKLGRVEAKLELSQEQRIKDGNVLTEVTTRATAAFEHLADLIRDRRRR